MPLVSDFCIQEFDAAEVASFLRSTDLDPVNSGGDGANIA